MTVLDRTTLGEGADGPKASETASPHGPSRGTDPYPTAGLDDWSAIHAPPAVLPRAVLRRRRTVAAIAALLAAAGLTLAGTGSVVAAAILGVVLLGAGAYAAALARVRRRSLDREFGLLASGRQGVEDLLELALHDDEAATVAYGLQANHGHGRSPWVQALAMAQFCLCCLAGWALAPVIFAFTVALGRTPQDSTGQRWLENLRSARARLEEDSRRALLVTAATTATVSGTAAVLAATPAGAATLPSVAHASAAPVAAAGAGATVHAGVYRVVAGDTLSSIAARYATTWSALAQANRIADPNRIYPGQVLVLPVGTVGSGKVHSVPDTYTVRAGDTLSGIAARFGLGVAQLAQINHLSDPNRLYQGQVLHLHSGAATPGGTTAPSRATVPARVTPVHAAPVPPIPARPSTPAPTPTAAVSAAPAPVAGASGSRQIAGQAALAQVGQPYEWGGAGAGGFDCSGLVMYAWSKAGVSLPHYTVSQYQDTVRIPEADLEPGDLVFYDTGSGAQPGHVAMYLGGGKVVTADTYGTNVRVEAITWDGTPMGFGRVA